MVQSLRLATVWQLSAAVFAAYMTSVARQPESQKTLQPMLFLGFALVEALAILGLVLVFIK